MASDEYLYEQVLRGDLEAMDALYQRFARHLFAFILSQLGERSEAEDVLHDTFMALLRERRQAAPTCFRAWIYQVARHLCLNRIRSRKRAARALEASQHLDGGPREQAEEVLISHRLHERLRGAVERLPSPLAELFHLRASGLSYEELATVLSIPVGTVKSRMHELVRRLRAEVKL